MDSRRAVRRSTAFIAAGMLVFSALMQAIFLIIGKWTLPVLFGNLLSGTVSVLNYWLLFCSVAKSAETEDEDRRKQIVKLSHIFRYLMIAAALAVGLLIPRAFSVWTVILPYFFPRIVMLFFPLFQSKID